MHCAYFENQIVIMLWYETRIKREQLDLITQIHYLEIHVLPVSQTILSINYSEYPLHDINLSFPILLCHSAHSEISLS